VAIARALANNPRLILADEPTASLDTYAVKSLELLKKIAKENQSAVIVVTHCRMIEGFDFVYHLKDAISGYEISASRL
jgi:putative ABC transport system ATP-binding protein